MPAALPYHHGVTIRAFRTQRGLTQAQLAERWPGGPVNPQYVQRVEASRKHITDQETLRHLSTLLDIPLWHFGLSEYDPFHPHHLPGAGARLYGETLDTIDCLVRQIWTLRCAALMTPATEGLDRLNALFGHFRRGLPPPARFEARYLALAAQAQRLNAVAAVERRDYAGALTAYSKMWEIARVLGEPGTLAMALISLASEQCRAGRIAEAVDTAEHARDVSFAAGKPIAAFVLTYLARVYAASRDEPRFERAISTAQAVVEAIGAAYGDGTDYVFARPSSVLAERSWGWLTLGRPHDTLALRPAITRQIELDGDRRLAAWIPLDWAQAYLMLGDRDQAVAEAHACYARASAMGSPHAQHQARLFLQGMKPLVRRG